MYCLSSMVFAQSMHSSLTSLQIPLCRDQLSRAHSALCGTAIRLAECMGLHKDGTDFGLNPVETHVRRLLWYQLCFLDIRTCEAQGPRPQIRTGEYDTKLPLNVDATNIDQSYGPSEPQQCWTDMTMFLIRTRCNEMQRVLWTDRLKIEKKQMSLTQVLGKIENFRRIMDEEFLPLMDENIPIQRAGLLIYKILTTRMHITVLHRYHNSVSQAIPGRLLPPPPQDSAWHKLTTQNPQIDSAKSFLPPAPNK